MEQKGGCIIDSKEHSQGPGKATGRRVTSVKLSICFSFEVTRGRATCTWEITAANSGCRQLMNHPVTMSVCEKQCLNQNFPL